jgi:SAM-dependent methyltransferase
LNTDNDCLSDEAAIARYNDTLEAAGEVEALVENTEMGPVQEFFEKVGGATGRDILDVGCATGQIAAQLYEAYPGWGSYQGVDITQAYLDAFNGRELPRATVKLASATCIPCPDRSKDIALCLFVHQHLSEECGQLALSEIARALRSGGLLLFGLTVVCQGETYRNLYASARAEAAGAEKVPTTHWALEAVRTALTRADLVADGWERWSPVAPGTRRQWYASFVAGGTSK